MILLNSKKILDCNLSEELIHENEIETIFNNINKLCNIDCALIINNSFEYESKTICKLHDIYDFLENFDYKNGVDIYQDEFFLTICLNGQTYNINNESHILQTYIKIFPLDAYGKPCRIYIEKLI